MINLLLLFFSAAVLLPEVTSLGCMPVICDGNPSNALRPCPDGDETCGHFHGKRKGGRIVDGVDIKCARNQVVHAPFDGEMYFWRPFGGRKGYECADKGLRIEGSGQWQGYFALIASIEPDSFGGQVKQGDRLGVSVSQACSEEMRGDFEEFVQLRLYRKGKLVDPTFHLKDCMCTGQICESNPTNALIGQGFKSDERYNGVRGWDIRCPMVDETEDGNHVEGENNLRPPWINSLIDGEIIGRMRLRTDDGGQYNGCDNDGVFIVGTGAWKGQPIAQRLTCDNAPDSVFIEMRKNGQVVDISDMIAAKSCKVPDELPLSKRK